VYAARVGAVGGAGAVGGLAMTGVQAVWLAGAGAGLVVLGFLLLRAAVHRRTRVSSD